MTDKLELGIIVELTEDVQSSFAKVTEFGLTTCQLMSWRPHILNESLASKVRDAARSTGVRVSSYWAGHSGKTIWNFIDGPTTIGLVPSATRAQRVEELKLGAQFAHWIDAPSITTHVGFIPENPADREFPGTVEAIRQVAQCCKDLGQSFCFETGQETPTTLLRTIEAVGTANLGINLDPANLLMYGKANPLDAANIFGKLVQGVHAKDGQYPTTGNELGIEKPLGAGLVHFDRLIPRLKELGFRGPLTIEREISGEQQHADIRHAMQLLDPLR
jgi:sugar phosphate isomerase/epimerase